MWSSQKNFFRKILRSVSEIQKPKYFFHKIKGKKKKKNLPEFPLRGHQMDLVVTTRTLDGYGSPAMTTATTFFFLMFFNVTRKIHTQKNEHVFSSF
jgi:hypothetical protein